MNNKNKEFLPAELDPLFYMNLEAQAGTLEYATEVQSVLGGTIKCDDGWYWVDA